MRTTRLAPLWLALMASCVARSEPEGPGAPPPPPTGSQEAAAGTADAAVTPGIATPPPSPADAGVVATSPPPPSPPCMRQRKGWVARCSGMAPRPGDPAGHEVTVCDHCIADADCTAQKGGRCMQVGGQMCTGAARMECRYPSAECGGEICPERPPSYPPSAPPRDR